MKYEAFHNLMQAADDQWVEAQKHMNVAMRFIGKAERTGNEPGDEFCRVPLEAAQRQIDRAARCLERSSAALEKALAIRPAIELTPKGLQALAEQKCSGGAEDLQRRRAEAIAKVSPFPRDRIRKDEDPTPPDAA